MPVIKNLTGQTFGRLTVIALAPHKNGRRRWHCLCECGTPTRVATDALTLGSTRSCGCLQSDTTRARSFKHGASHRGAKTRAYNIWANMRGRCLSPSASKYADYGGRGITISERWDDFANFLADMGEPPPGKTIDRTDNSKGYSAANCAWRSPAEQNRNRRDNVHLTTRGRTLTVTEWERESGAVSRKTMVRRLAKGWSHEDAIFRPI